MSVFKVLSLVKQYFANSVSETNTPILPPIDLLSDEPPLETYRHLKQIILLLTSLERLWQNRQDFFAGANLSIYYSTRQRKSEDV